MEVALVFVSHRPHDFLHVHVGGEQQLFGCGEPAVDEQAAEGRAEQLPDAPRQVFEAVPRPLREVGERGARIVFFEVGGDLLPQPDLGGCGPVSLGERCAVFREVCKEEGNELREHRVVRGSLLGERVDEVVQQVAHGENFPRAEVQVFPLAGRAEIFCQEAEHHGVVLHPRQYLFEEGIRHHEVYPDVADIRAQDGVTDMPVQEEDIPAAERDLLPVHDVRDAAGIHIHELHVVMSVLGKIRKARVQAQVDQLSLAQHFLLADDKFFGGGIVRAADGGVPLADALFFGSYRRQPFDDALVHASIIPRIRQNVNPGQNFLSLRQFRTLFPHKNFCRTFRRRRARGCLFAGIVL